MEILIKSREISKNIFNMPNKRFVEWGEFYGLSEKLFDKIPKGSLDMILAIGRGGLILGRLASDYFGKDLAIIMAKHYKEGAYESNNPWVHFGVISSTKPVEGRILLIDDLFDEGATMKQLMIKMKKPDVKETKTAVLFVKPMSDIKPDYHVEETSDWIVFPYEKKEFEDKN